MISDQNQYRLEKLRLEEFERALRDLESSLPPVGMHPIIQAAEIDEFRKQLEELRGQLREYEQRSVE
jgi:hypothetical protein